MARGSHAGAGLSIAPSAAPPPPAAAPAAEPAEVPDPTPFRHGAIRLVGEPAAEPEHAAERPPALAAVEPEPGLAAVEPEPAAEPEPAPEPAVPASIEEVPL